MAISKAFVWGEGGAQLTPEQIAKQREIEDALLQRGVDTSPVGSAYEGLARVANAAAGSFRRGRLARAENENKAYDTEAFNKIVGLMGGGAVPTATTLPGSSVADEIKATDPSIDVADNDIYSPFIETVKAGGLSNPYGLAAVAATGKAESGWSPANANRSWSDPSESGQAGTAGGVMSWRAERLQNLYNYASSKGEKPGAISPQTQAEFFLREDPQLIARLNAAKSPEEAADMMADAWKFAGYDRPGGEAARRRSYASAYLPKFQGGNEVASLDPSAGMASAAIERQAPASGYVDPVISAPNYQPPAAAPQSPQAEATLPPLPSRDVAPAPAVASVPPVQVAQAAPQAVTAPNGAPIPPEILQVLGDPRVSQRTRGIATLLLQQQQARNQAILEQRLKQADPGYQADLRLKTIQADQLANPKISPAEQARIDMDKEKFGYEKQSGTDKLTLEREKFNADRENNRLTSDIKEYDAYAADERAAGRTPIGRLDYQQAVKKAGSSSTNVTVGEGDSFYKELDKKNAETFSTLSQSGMEARGKLARIDRLEGLMTKAPQGAVGALKQAAGEWGIPTEGLSDIQAATALLEKMVPEQRQPGSGPMSDSDIKMFRASLPRTINQPGGNQLIFQTMRGIAQYEQQMGEIADRVANREINPAEGRRQIQALANPLAEFKIPSGPTPNEGFQDRPDLGPGVRIRKKAD
ncbi:hypothetical protein J2T08_002973 [Neorhizobium galegae]|uniref:phage tail tip lysozyme n=1 Tax=Neorhizobium galegae TaxID=399 RepID=UPI00278680E0|nr:phage tail tip lysozyme [Neorhizobium galegae]MDQ0135052.1 hypothetical protein [Neorhizobium galegae]